MHKQYNIAVSRYDHAINLAVSIVGSKNELANKIGASPASVTYWSTRKKRMGYDYALAIEEATNGQVKASDLFLSRANFERGLKS